MKIYLSENYCLEIDEAIFRDSNLNRHTGEGGGNSHILRDGEEFNWRDPKFDSSMTKDDYAKEAEALSNAKAGNHKDNSDPENLNDKVFGWVFHNPKYGSDRKFKVKIPSGPTKFNPNALPELVIYSADDSTIITYMLLKGPRSLYNYEDQFVKELNENLLELPEDDEEEKKMKKTNRVNFKDGVGDMDVANAAFNSSADSGSAPVVESIEKHKELNPKLWDEDDRLLPEVEEGIKKIVNQFITELKENQVELKVLDIILVGSNASYNYTKDSDLDVHIVADTSIIPCEYGLLPIIYNMARSQFNSKYDVTIHGVPIEIYVEDMNTSANSNGIYSLNRGWIKKPVAMNIPEIDISDKYPIWEKKAKKLLSGGDTTVDQVDQFIDDVYLLRKTSIMSEGEYGKGNMVFKELRNNGYLDKLKELKVDLTEKDMVVEKLDEVYFVDQKVGKAMDEIHQNKQSDKFYSHYVKHVGSNADGDAKMPNMLPSEYNELANTLSEAPISKIEFDEKGELANTTGTIGYVNNVDTFGKYDVDTELLVIYNKDRAISLYKMPREKFNRKILKGTDRFGFKRDLFEEN